jgi:hypothetical protein
VGDVNRAQSVTNDEEFGGTGMGSAGVTADRESPPEFARLVAHPLPWRLLRELVQSDRAVWELTERLHKPQHLVSYHLRQLRWFETAFTVSPLIPERGVQVPFALAPARCQGPSGAE